MSLYGYVCLCRSQQESCVTVRLCLSVQVTAGELCHCTVMSVCAGDGRRRQVGVFPHRTVQSGKCGTGRVRAVHAGR